MHGRVNCFDATGNLIIVIECKTGAFFKKIMVAGAHLRIIILLNRVKWSKMDLKSEKNIKVFIWEMLHNCCVLTLRFNYC